MEVGFACPTLDIKRVFLRQYGQSSTNWLMFLSGLDVN